jgi:hypothetical protein
LDAAGLGTLQGAGFGAILKEGLHGEPQSGFGCSGDRSRLVHACIGGRTRYERRLRRQLWGGSVQSKLPGSSGGQNASGWTVVGTNSSFPDGYAFIFNNSNSFTTTNSSVGPASGSANPGGSNTLPLWGASGDGSPEGSYFYGVDSTYHPSALTQEISGLTVGRTYTLTFDYAAAQQFQYAGNTIDQWVVTLGGQTIATTNIDLPSHEFSGWFTDSVTFTYDGSGTDLSFVNNGKGVCDSNFLHCAINDPTASGGPPFSLLDGVSLNSSVPEPST